MPRTTVLGAFIEGWRRVLGAPWIAAGVLAAMALLAMPPYAWQLTTFWVGDEANAAAIERMVDRAKTIRNQEQGVGWIFVHGHYAFGGRTVDLGTVIVSDMPGGGVPIPVAFSGTLLIWLLVSGGVLDRFARARAVGTAAFFAASGVYFVRFLRLGVILGVAYYALFVWVYPHGIAGVYRGWTEDIALARDAWWPRATLNAVFLVLLVALGIVADFAKVRSVVEDRHSMIGAVAASLRFVRRRLVRVVVLYALNVAVMLAVIQAWLWLSGGFQWSLADFYVTTLLFIWTRLAFMASDVVFFQNELAHASYTAAPLPVWPDSPAAEAMENLTGQRAEGKGQREGQG